MLDDIMHKITKLEEAVEELCYKMVEAEGDQLFYLEEELEIAEQELSELKQEKEELHSNEYSLTGE
jgi:hypothetical protein